MSTAIDRIESLDVTLFDAIPSQTSPQDRRSLLAVQRATVRRNKEYTYLEIGSYLGGSIQPHLLDARCKRIYSIDPRPPHPPDDRSHGYIAGYDDNSPERMMKLLGNVGDGDIKKIHCVNLDASQVAPSLLEDSPQVAFIDGEHTTAAVLSDFGFCDKVMSRGGTILFHDFFIVYPAILSICRMLSRQRRECIPLKLEDSIFAIFFDPEVVHSDPYLASLFERNKHFLPLFRLRMRVRPFVPGPVLGAARTVRDLLRKAGPS